VTAVKKAMSNGMWVDWRTSGRLSASAMTYTEI
jgi:hypothetical protein